MTEQTRIAVDHVTELSHPFRFRLVGGLAHGPRTVSALATELGTPAGVVLHHVEALRALGFVEQVATPDGAVTYELVRVPVLQDEDWGELPVEARRAGAASALTYMGARAAAAVDHGGFDRFDVHLSRTTLAVDEQAWRELTALFHTVLDDLRARSEAPPPAPRPDATFEATAMLLLFTGEHVEAPSGPAAVTSEEDAQDAADSLLDGLSSALCEPQVAWGEVEVLAERLRIIARGAKEAPPARVIPLRPDVGTA